MDKSKQLFFFFVLLMLTLLVIVVYMIIYEQQFLTMLVFGAFATIMFLLVLFFVPADGKTAEAESDNRSNCQDSKTKQPGKALSENKKQLTKEKKALERELKQSKAELSKVMTWVSDFLNKTHLIEGTNDKRAALPEAGALRQDLHLQMQYELINYEKLRPHVSTLNYETIHCITYSFKLYQALNESGLTEDSKNEILNQKCAELNKKLQFVKLVNYGTQTIFDEHSHTPVAGAGSSSSVAMLSFKIENLKTGSILQKALVKSL